MPSCRLILLAAMLMLPPVAGRAAAPAIPLEMGAVRPALSHVLELLRAAQERGALPRLSDPAVGPSFQAILDPRLVAPGRAFAKSELAVLSFLCATAGKIVHDYLSFRSHGHPDLAKPGNSLLYQPEIAAGADFWLRCEAVVIEGVATVVAALPPEQLNDAVTVDFEQLRDNAFRNVWSMLELIREGSLRGSSVDRLAASLRESGPRFVAAFPPQERRQLAAVVRDVLPHVGMPARTDMEAFIAMLTTP